MPNFGMDKVEVNVINVTGRLWTLMCLVSSDDVV